MSDKITMAFEDGRGKEVTRDVHMALNAADCRGTPIYPWLVIAANPHLSAPDILRFFELEAERGLAGIRRPLSWIRRKRWMAQFPDHINMSGPRPDDDAQYRRAVAIMRANPTMSARALARLLKENGVDRGKDWVCLHRV
jgi:hypothetical protein